MSQQQQQQAVIVRHPNQITPEMRWNYFRDAPPSPKIRYYVFAVLLILGIILFHSWPWTIVFVLCFIPIVWRFVRWIIELNRPVMTDREYMQWIWFYAQDIKEEGRRKFAMGQAASSTRTLAEPQIIQGFVFKHDQDAGSYSSRYVKKGMDNRYRSSVSRFIVLYLLEHELGIYVRDINALKDFCIKKDSTHYYEMVNSISMKTHGNFGADGTNDPELKADYFSIVMTSGHEIGMSVVRDDDMIDRTVAELRRLLGEKRYPKQNRHPEGIGGYAGIPNGYAGVPNQYFNTGPYPGASNNYPGIPNPYPNALNPYDSIPSQYPANTGPYPGAPNNYPGAPNPYPGNTRPFPGSPNPYPGGPPLYSNDTYPNSGIPNPNPERAND